MAYIERFSQVGCHYSFCGWHVLQGQGAEFKGNAKEHIVQNPHFFCSVYDGMLSLLSEDRSGLSRLNESLLHPPYHKGEQGQ